MSALPNLSLVNYLESEAKTACRAHVSNKSFGVLCINIRSLSAHWAEFLSLLSTLPSLPKCIILNETWLNSDQAKLYNIKNFNSFHLCRTTKRGGGVSIYMHVSLKLDEKASISINNDNMELLGVGLKLGTKRLQILSIYRPPAGNSKQFIDSLLSHIDNSETKNFLMGGDMNIDLLQRKTSQSRENLLMELTSRGFVLANSIPTRPNMKNIQKSTLIDHIWTNTELKNPVSYTIQYPISDHLPILVAFELNTYPQAKQRTVSIEYRKFTDENILRLKRNLENENWSFLDDPIDMDAVFDQFENRLLKHYNNCISIEKKNVKPSDNSTPWMNENLKRRIKQKQINFKLFRRGLVSGEFYKKFAKQTQNMINWSKARYHRRMLSSASGAADKWKQLKNIVGMEKANKTPITMLRDDTGGEITDGCDIANQFNSYFADVGLNTAKSIQRSSTSFTEFLSTPQNNCFKFFECNQSEVESTLQGLKNKKDPIQNFPTHLLKQLRKELSMPLSRLITISFKLGRFPDRLKEARVVPVFKAGDTKSPSNYRPISILPPLSKLFEKIVHRRLYKFLTKFEILHESQFGFRNGHSTTDALTLILEKLHGALERREVSMNIYLDLSKAFDTVDHQILLSKLDHYGVRGTELSWFKDYLSNRRQAVEVDKIRSGYKNITVGVPQGSILGPLLFTIMINDVFDSIDLPIVCYADDSTIIASAKSVDELTNKVNDALKSISSWMASNQMKLNAKKTKYSFFTNKKSSKIPEPVLGNEGISRAHVFKILGLQLDEGLRFANHTRTVRSKLAFCSHIMKRANYNMPLSNKITLYNAYVKPSITYGITAWGSTNKKYLEKINTMQNKIVKGLIPRGLYPRDNYKILNLMTLEQLTKYECCQFMHRIFHNTSPQCIKDIFNTKVSHRYPTRKANVRLPSIRLASSSKSISFRGPAEWNTIPPKIKILPRSSFKEHLKKHLMAS